MAVRSGMNRVWTSYRRFRSEAKAHNINLDLVRTQAYRSRAETEFTEALELDEAVAAFVGEQETDVDPRFVNNPHGIGCSKHYESFHDDNNWPSAGRRTARSPWTIHKDEDEMLRWPTLETWGVWRAENIDVSSLPERFCASTRASFEGTTCCMRGIAFCC